MSLLVSIIMPVYNAEKYLREAIESILTQTFSDFEFIILDDGSTDDSQRIIMEYQKRDVRIIYRYFEENRGISRVLNDGLAMARGQYIARMDADDISLPYRLEKQVIFMEANPDIGICGSWIELIGTFPGQMWKHPTSHDAICARMLFANALVHPSVMMRKTVLQANNLFYDSIACHVEDYDLWSRALSLTRFANIDDILLFYRIHSQNTARKHGNAQKNGRSRIYRFLLGRLCINPSDEDLFVHQMISSHSYNVDYIFLRRAQRWLVTLQKNNRNQNWIPSDVFENELGERWTGICRASRVNILLLATIILFSPLRFRGVFGMRKLTRLIGFCFGKLRNKILAGIK